jgi:hypothetical protein
MENPHKHSVYTPVLLNLVVFYSPCPLFNLSNAVGAWVIDGDVEYLRLKNGREIFSIFMESEADKPKGGIIILHNRGQHANWSVENPHKHSVYTPVLLNLVVFYSPCPLFNLSNAVGACGWLLSFAL